MNSKSANMNCLIDTTINKYYARGKKVEVIKRYIRMKYRISLDAEVLKARLKEIKPKSLKVA